MVPPCSDRIARVPPYSRTARCVSHTGLSPATARLSRRFWYSIAQATGLVRVRSPLLAESRLMSFPPATEMFQFAGFASRTYVFSRDTALREWVAPFGDPGIKDRSHLPLAYRSVPRPSSPLSAKASTKCPYLTLDRKTRRLQGQAPQTQTVSHEDTLDGSIASHRRSAISRSAVSRSFPSHSLFTLSKTSRRPAEPSAFRSLSPMRNLAQAVLSSTPSLRLEARCQQLVARSWWR